MCLIQTNLFHYLFQERNPLGVFCTKKCEFKFNLRLTYVWKVKSSWYLYRLLWKDVLSYDLVTLLVKHHHRLILDSMFDKTDVGNTYLKVSLGALGMDGGKVQLGGPHTPLTIWVKMLLEGYRNVSRRGYSGLAGSSYLQGRDGRGEYKTGKNGMLWKRRTLSIKCITVVIDR